MIGRIMKNAGKLHYFLPYMGILAILKAGDYLRWEIFRPETVDVDGEQFRISPADDGLSRDLFLDSDREPTAQALLRCVNQGNTIIDLGANMGYYTRKLSEIVGNTGKVYALEPVQKNYDILAENTEHLENTTIMKLAIGDQNKALPIGVSDKLNWSGFNIESKESEIVNMKTLDSFTEEQGIRPDLIRMDVEGYEYEIIKNAKNLMATHSPKFMVEVHPHLMKERTKEFLLMLKDAGYELTALGIDPFWYPHVDSGTEVNSILFWLWRHFDESEGCILLERVGEVTTDLRIEDLLKDEKIVSGKAPAFHAVFEKTKERQDAELMSQIKDELDVHQITDEKEIEVLEKIHKDIQSGKRKTITEEQFLEEDKKDLIEATFEYRKHTPTEKESTPEYKEYRRQWEEYPKKHITATVPTHLDLEVTNRCNLKCIMCFHSLAPDKLKPFGDMDINLYKKLIDEFSEKGGCSLKLMHRGEPLLHPDIVEMVRYAKDKGLIEVMFNTNATLLSPEMSKNLIEAGLDKLICSVDGCTKEVYESVRVGANFETVLQNIKDLQRIKKELNSETPKLRIQMVDTPKNHDQIEDYIKFWGEFADDIAVEKMNDWTFKESQDEIMECKGFDCPMNYQRMIVWWDGRVVMCCGNLYGKLIYGNLTSDTIEEVWNNNRIWKTRLCNSTGESHRIRICSECGFRKTVINDRKLEYKLVRTDGEWRYAL